MYCQNRKTVHRNRRFLAIFLKFHRFGGFLSGLQGWSIKGGLDGARCWSLADCSFQKGVDFKEVSQDSGWWCVSQPFYLEISNPIKLYRKL